MRPQLLVRRVVAPKVTAGCERAERNLDPSQRRAKGAHLGAVPVTNAREPARAGVDMDIVFEQINVVGHKRPSGVEERGELGDEFVEMGVEMGWQCQAEAQELRGVLVQHRQRICRKSD
ncbi:hypothetical protein BM221_002108 [Beauveria bassiana]|uniref:Uncharacterized protein n=1 Tax=Beauveria bassiana TaxID=176275 RepID=A0A2N6NXK8_BEABA|nr:hypothetical protein BM221_002108 [Beauveria bassiana]